MPSPATYVIDRSMQVRYAFVEEDYSQRANIEELKRVIRDL
ncbi:MAG: hypothetical protein ACFB10_23130 [Salibacteraceae bacterium]